MELQAYFDFQNPDDIRIKGTRVGIETVYNVSKLGMGKIEVNCGILALRAS